MGLTYLLHYISTLLKGITLRTQKIKSDVIKQTMPIFGMNGLMALGLDFALIFAVYGMKEVALTKNQVATVGRVVARKGLSGDKGRDASVIRQARASVIESMGRKMGRYTTTEAEKTAFAAKTWLR